VVLPIVRSASCPKGFVQDYGEEIAGMWLAALRDSAQTPSYGVVSDEELVSASEFALSQVDEHFSGRQAEGDTAAFFHKLGATRAAQGLRSGVGERDPAAQREVGSLPVPMACGNRPWTCSVPLTSTGNSAASSIVPCTSQRE